MAEFDAIIAHESWPPKDVVGERIRADLKCTSTFPLCPCCGVTRCALAQEIPTGSSIYRECLVKMRAEAGIESLGLGGGTNNQRSELGGLAEGEKEVAQRNKANVCPWI